MSNAPEVPQLKAKIIGKNTSLVIDGQLYKNVLEQEDKARLKDYIDKYNKKPSDFWLIKIKKLLTPKQIVKAERIEKKKAEVAEKMSIDDIKKLKEELAMVASANKDLVDKNKDLEEQIKVLAEKATNQPKAKEGIARKGEH